MTMQNPLFGRGQYDSASENSHHAGAEREFEDLDYSSRLTPRLSSHVVRCRLVKNSSGIALTPGRLVTFKAGTLRTEVDGYARLTAADSVPTDEYLPAAGVPADSYFWVVVHGPAGIMTDLAAGANNLLPETTVLVALTAATSQATTAGRVAPQDLTGATAVLGDQIQGGLGRAISARTTANTNVLIRAFISKRWD